VADYLTSSKNGQSKDRRMNRLDTSFRLPKPMSAPTVRSPFGHESGAGGETAFPSIAPATDSGAAVQISGGAASSRPMYAVAAGVSLNPSDFNLIARTTGVTMKDHHFYDSKGAEITDMGSHQDAMELYTLLTDMRSLKFGKGGAAITSQDIDAYLRDGRMSGWSADDAILRQAKGSAPT
jgi:hypothetical protein